LVGHILRRKCVLKQIIEGTIEGGLDVTGRQEGRRKQLLHKFKETRGISRSVSLGKSVLKSL
jgi:hypothetical protein